MKTVLYDFGTKKRAAHIRSVLRESTRGVINVAHGICVESTGTKTRPVYRVCYLGPKKSAQFLKGFLQALFVLERGRVPKRFLSHCLNPDSEKGGA